MLIEANKVVSFHYEMKEFEGDVLESSDGSDPLLYLHGHKGMLVGIEEAMEGRQAGDQFSIDLEPEKAYGIRQDDNSIHRVPIKHLQHKGKLKPGMVVQVNTKDGLRDVSVVKVGKFNVDVDANHPLAGKKLTFDITIVDVRDATSEEISRGHAHGVGGRQQ